MLCSVVTESLRVAAQQQGIALGNVAAAAESRSFLRCSFETVILGIHHGPGRVVPSRFLHSAATYHESCSLCQIHSATASNSSLFDQQGFCRDLAKMISWVFSGILQYFTIVGTPLLRKFWQLKL
ncbi:hypothetical protein R1flu_022682 [Riccia fluitans]|uniref:Uncharacterized protein n=1 Tax=Riccia fluitans TaxID=41844 RepID=A0ABD1XQF1_9MARC